MTGWGNKDGMLKLGGKRTVNSTDSPTIGRIDCNLPVFGCIDHRLDGKDHSWPKDDIAVGGGKVVDKWFFVKLETDTMAAKVADGGIAELRDILFDCLPDTGVEMATGFELTDGFVHGLAGALDD